MNIIISGRQLNITPALKSYVELKVEKFEKYVSNITEAVVTLSVEKYRYKAEVLLKIEGALIQAEGVTDEIYSVIDEVVEKLEKQVIKYKERLRCHRKGEKRERWPSLAVEAEKGRIIKHKRFDMKPMIPEEAADQMELLDKDFFVFANPASSDINVIYRRKDGNYGLIEPIK
ncbi:ribosome-associated translation inhibitor RaiA [Thermodesulfovibrionales bacterium]|nr:ribosome-associated translation inhibitor RaiA [Thermodesulfovibrionales bacterium]